MTDFPIVGAKFRPPALGILSILPAGARLVARRESTNQYDANAVQVLWPTEVAQFVTRLGAINDLLLGYGTTLSALADAPEWHLGYVPRDMASELAPKMDSAQRPTLQGQLTFSASGNPRIQLTEEI
jgi:HIRAN domain-containing protein